MAKCRSTLILQLCTAIVYWKNHDGKDSMVISSKSTNECLQYRTCWFKPLRHLEQMGIEQSSCAWCADLGILGAVSSEGFDGGNFPVISLENMTRCAQDSVAFAGVDIR